METLLTCQVLVMNSYRSPVLDPAAMPQVALASMNATHREELTLVNQLGALLEQGMGGEADEPAISAKVNEWIEHTRDHFARENQLMQAHGFPPYPMHSGEHERVLQELEKLKQQWLDGKAVEPLAHFLFVDWLEWFGQHVNTMDRITAQFLKGFLIE